MDIKRLLPLLALLGVFIYGGWKLKSTLSSTTQSHSISHSFDPTQVRKNLGRYLRESRADDPQWIENSKEVPQECSSYFTQLQSLDLISLGQDHTKIQYQQIPSPGQGCAIVDPEFQLAEKSYLEACFQSDANRSDLVSDECTQAIFFLRANMTKVLLSQVPMAEVKDLKHLTDLLFAEFMGPQRAQRAPDFERMRAISQRMLEVNPHLYVAAKVSAFSEIASYLSQSKEVQSQDWAHARQLLERAQRMNSDDRSLKDARVAVETQGFDPQKTVSFAHSSLEQNPRDDRAHFLLAYGQWRSGNRSAASDSLLKAIELNPQSSEYRQTLDSISAPDASESSFTVSMSLSVQLDDFQE